ncbi:MAG TPA: N-acetyl-gamma-glutamyl-phosphate reductase [bacterium]|nr:N-acetyl-gamma-glutamyl-phosphate reductase [bacterium]
MKSVAVVGASGFTGRELLHLLRRHRGVRAVPMSARADAPPRDSDTQPLDMARLGEFDGVFLCTPHGAAATLAATAVAAGARVVDLSADFRLRDPAIYEQVYGAPHPAPEHLAEAVYGLTEHARPAVRSARLVANPGCYPTSVLLPLLPLCQNGLLDEAAPIIADSKSGASGAGARPTERTHFGNVHENFLAYGIGTHRHTPEIHQQLGSDRLVFTPHLLPVFRGILSTIYVTPARGIDDAAVRSCLMEHYGGEPFVAVLPDGTPELRDVQRSNRCHIAAHASGPLIVLTSAIDNLGKGASGQALQNMNLMLGFHETEALT